MEVLSIPGGVIIRGDLNSHSYLFCRGNRLHPPLPLPPLLLFVVFSLVCLFLPSFVDSTLTHREPPASASQCWEVGLLNRSRKESPGFFNNVELCGKKTNGRKNVSHVLDVVVFMGLLELFWIVIEGW